MKIIEILKSISIAGTLSALLLVLLLSSCSDDDDLNGFLEVDRNDSEWVDQFNELSRGDTLDYMNGAFIILENLRASNIAVDCNFDDAPRQCHYKVMTLSFHSPFESLVTYLTVFVFGNRQMVINYSDTSTLEPEILIHNLRDKETIVPQTDSFFVVYDEDRDRFDVETTNPSPLFASLPPAKFIFTKEGGIIEWSDYSNNRFLVEE
jgi:hypothetical protein